MVVVTAVRSNMRESVKGMEGKVRAAMFGVKVGNLNTGKETDDRAYMVKKVLEELRKAEKREEGQLDKVLRWTRVVLYGDPHIFTSPHHSIYAQSYIAHFFHFFRPK